MVPSIQHAHFKIPQRDQLGSMVDRYRDKTLSDVEFLTQLGTMGFSGAAARDYRDLVVSTTD